MRSRLHFLAVLTATAAVLTHTNANDDKTYKHVAIFSIDGMHSSDVEKYVAIRPGSTIAKLLSHAYEYTDAFTTAPSDSFPGATCQFTGATPKTTGVWYDDIWDRSLYPPGSDCSGPPGAEIAYAENLDYDSTLLFSGGINPANLPKIKKPDGSCDALYPHQRLRVNTLWEVVVANGYETAYADKHPSYDIMRGPSGTGLTQAYFPEIQAVPVTVDATITYDTLHVNAWLDWINGGAPVNFEGVLLKGIPTLFGGNFQAVSVGQKAVSGGYIAAPGFPFTPNLLKAFDFVDGSLGKIVDAMKNKGIYDDTLIVIASKHGQAPIDHTKYGKVDPDAVTNATGVDVTFQTSDDIALIFLADPKKDLDKAVDNLNRKRNALKIESIVSGERLVALGFGDPSVDPAVPDIIVEPELGIIYTTSSAKIAEHGGFSVDDRKVACFLSNPKLEMKKFGHRVETKQIAPTLLKVLGLKGVLEGVETEGTRVLDGFS